MQLLWDKLENWLNDYSLRKKLIILYLLCVLAPLILTDSAILYNVVRAEQSKLQSSMENDASAVQYMLTNSVEAAATTAKNIYISSYINDFLSAEYETAFDYVVAYQTFLQDSLFESSISMNNIQVTIYADNETIVNGGTFSRLSTVQEAGWYQHALSSGKNTNFFFYYDDWKSPAVEPKRKIFFTKEMDFYAKGNCDKLLKIEIDYSNLVRTLDIMNYEFPIYICQDGKILLSNDGHNNVGQPFETFEMSDRVGYEKEITIYDSTFQIYILKHQTSVFEQISHNIPLILLLVVINVLLPLFLMTMINRSFSNRIRELSTAFESVKKDELIPIPKVRGKDEIGTLMQNYNRMVDRTNELIQTVYKNRLKEQEMDIARQNAELLALHSQINPHFLFNALESIRMHSILRQEYETADMVEKLAIMERQNVDWGNDFIEIKKEMEFVEAYLGLQKYRFGDRLSYSLEVEEDCARYHIPKLTVVTFVENACVHGIESKTAPGWIFVRIYKEKEELCIEVEDTGGGMSEELLADIQDKMQNASIKRLKEKGRVGIMNACLRLKMLTEDTVRFSIESEQAVGTMIQIRIPLERLSSYRIEKVEV